MKDKLYSLQLGVKQMEDEESLCCLQSVTVPLGDSMEYLQTPCSIFVRNREVLLPWLHQGKGSDHQ